MNRTAISFRGRRRRGRFNANIRRRQRRNFKKQFNNAYENGSNAKDIEKFGKSKITENSAWLGNGMPDKLNIKLKWHQNFHLETITAQAAVIIRGNVPYDPEIKLGGNSALDYAFLQNLYRYCRVYASTIVVNGAVINQQGFQFAVSPQRSDAPTTFNRLVSDKRTKVSKYIQSGGISCDKIVHRAQTNSIYGVPSIEYDVDHGFDTDHGTAPGSSVTIPNYQWFWFIFAQNHQAQTGVNAAFSVTIEHEVQFRMRYYGPQLGEVTGDVDNPPEEMLDNEGTNVTPDPPLDLDTQTGLILDTDDDVIEEVKTPIVPRKALPKVKLKQ